MRIEIPELCLVALVGASGSGKSTFARTHFLPTEIVSSDTCRGLVDDDENSLDATTDAFELVHYLARKRLKRGKLVAIDATNVQAAGRKTLLEIANAHYVPAIAIVIDTPESVCLKRNEERPDRQFGPHVVRNHVRDLRRSLGTLRRERFKQIYVVKPGEDVEVVRLKSWTDRREEGGPFDIIGDVHGCYEELAALLSSLGYSPTDGTWSNPEGRRAVFVGDLVDRGPDSPGVLKLVMAMCAGGHAICVPGNHDSKLVKYLMGRDVTIAHGLDLTIAQLDQEPPEFREQVRVFLDSLISHAVLDDGKLVVAHAGCREEMQGRAHGRVRDFCLYGETTGELDEFGLPVRYLWAEEYRGRARVVYGHTPVREPEWLNRTTNIDTGCVFGGKLTALRYPEMEIVQVPAKQAYADPGRPIGRSAASSGLNSQQAYDDVLNLAEVSGKMYVDTSLSGKVTVREENATAALEVISRFAANPKWLVYLPPTMSPSATSQRPGYLEYPTEAFEYFRENGVQQVVCEQKHMGSRSVIVVCREARVALKRFGVTGDSIGAVLTRTGRRFFNDEALEAGLLSIVRDALVESEFFTKMESDWVVLDCELMPWSAKAVDLLKRQYAPAGAASLAATTAIEHALRSARESGVEGLDDSVTSWQRRRENATKFVTAYRNYCWPVASLEDYRLAPFHIMATEGKVHTDQTNLWHMESIAAVCSASDSPVLRVTPHQVVNLADEVETESACQWWESLVSSGGEGMVVKPMDFVVKGKKGLVQPAMKVRGPEYLRIIYGSDYLEEANLMRLRRRSLTSKRSLAAREFALGIEGLERFVRREPLRTVHQCAFAVLALESEPVDPRL